MRAGSSMTSNRIAGIYQFLSIRRCDSRPYVSNDGSSFGAAFKAMKYCPALPERFGSLETPAPFAASSTPIAAANSAT